MTDPLERLTNLVALLLETRIPLTLDQIAHELRGQYPANDPARRTAFERDKRQLRDEGVPLEQTVLSGDQAGATGYWIDRSRYALPDLGLTPDEARALRLAVATVHLGEDWGGDALRKIDAGSTDGDATASGDHPVVAALPAHAAMPALFQANSDRSTVEFTYRDRRRTLEPYGLLARAGFWYVMGHDRDAGEVRTYRVDRIQGGVDVGRPDAYVIPAGFDPAAAFPADAKMVGEGEVVSALVDVTSGQAPTVVQALGDAAVVERRADGSIVVTVPYANRWAFRSWLLGLVDDAVVVEPPELRAEVEAWLEQIIGASGTA